jgi:hypothetical protein
LSFRRFISLFIKAFLTSANHSQNFAFFEVDFSNCVILSIANINKMLSLPVDMAKTLREMELNLLVAAVDQPHFAIADGGLTLHRLLIDDEDSIVG